MKYSPDVLPGGDRIESCRLAQRAKVAMDSVCDLITTSQPHFVFCFKAAKVTDCWLTVLISMYGLI